MFKNENDFKKIVDRLNIDTEPNPTHRENLRRQLLSTFNETRIGLWQKFGRTIMKSPIIKLAAAAVIIIAAVLSVTVLDKSIPSAYALEQTLKAYEGLHFVHIKVFRDDKSEPIECWVEFDEHEQVKNLRVHIPGWESSSGVPKIAIWNNGRLQLWIKNENALLMFHDNSFALKIHKIMKESDPRFTVKELYQLESEGKVEIKTSKPTLKSEPIIITAKFLPQSNDPGRQMVLSVDQNTMLVTRVVITPSKDFGGCQNSEHLEFSDYNMKIDESVFTLSEVPENVEGYDLTKIGLEQGELDDNDIAVEVARQFIQALIDKDYAKAGKLYCGLPAEKMQWLGENITYKKIICIEQPTPRPVKNHPWALNVPCVFVGKYLKSSRVYLMRQNINVEPAIPDVPNKTWVVNGRIETPSVITEDPTDTTSTFLKNINSRLALLDINKSTADDVISVLGEPWAYVFEDKDLDKDNLPETYRMTYPGFFIVVIHKNQVLLWGSEVFPGYAFSDSIQIGTALDEVLKELGPPAKIVEEFDDGRHGSKEIMFEDNVIYANMNINERKGFCVYRYDSNGEKIRTYLDDNVLYQNMNKTKGLCFYGTVSKGKRIKILFVDNKVFSIHEYRTDPIKTIE